MPGPNFVFALIVATLLALIFFFVINGDGRRLAFFLVAGWVGFYLGHQVGISLGIMIWRLGDINVFAAIVGASIALVIVAVLTLEQH